MNEDLKQHIISTLNKGMRLDGRKPLEYRPLSVNLNFTKNAEGSAEIFIGETHVMVGVKMSVEKPFPDTAAQGGIMVNAELLPMSSPDFESGPPSIQAIELARVVDRGIRESKSVDFEKLCIEEGEKAWFVSVDVVSINDAGNLFDAAALGAIIALREARFPTYDGKKIDYKKLTKEALPLTKHPVSVTVCKIGDHLIVDPLPEEEKILDARLTVASTEDGKLCALQKGGDSPLKPEVVMKMIEIGLDKAKEIRKSL